MVLEKEPANSKHIPKVLVNLIAEWDDYGDKHAEDRAKINADIEGDIAAVAYQPIMPGRDHGDFNRLSPGLVKLAAGSTVATGLLYVKRQVYDVGLQVLWHNFAYGPGKLTTWLGMFVVQVFSFIAMSKLSNKIFNSPRWVVFSRDHNIYYRDPYMRIGEHLFLTGCLYLNLMVIDKVVTQRLVSSS